MKKETTKITINLSKDLLEKIKVVAKVDETTVSALIRRLLIDYLKERTYYDSRNSKTK